MDVRRISLTRPPRDVGFVVVGGICCSCGRVWGTGARVKFFVLGPLEVVELDGVPGKWQLFAVRAV